MSITINGKELQFNPGETVLQVARRAGIDIPHLCSLDWAPSPSASCRLCVVEVEGSPKLQTSCTLPATDGMAVHTHTPRILKARRAIVELMVANHPQDCLVCHRSGTCELADLAQELGARPKQYVGMKKDQPLDISSPAIWRDPNKCVLCGRCVTMCHQIQGIGAIDFIDRGFRTQVGPGFFARHQRLGLHVLRPMRAGLPDRRPHGAQPRGRSGGRARRSRHRGGRRRSPPRCRPPWRPPAAEPPTVPVMLEHLAAALKRIGVAAVFDTGFAADLTIMEEATELVKRLQGGGPLPMFTSCSPAWVNYVELHRPDLIPNMSTCKSPQQMAGALIKEIYPKFAGLDDKRLVLVSLMPCTAKKYEAQDLGDVDYVLTTRELGALWERFGIDFDTFEERAPLDPPFAEATGAARLFAGTGGVMEAAVRTAATLVGAEAPAGPLTEARGLDGVKCFTLDVGDTTLKLGSGERAGPSAAGPGGGPRGHALRRGHVVPGRLRRRWRPALPGETKDVRKRHRPSSTTPTPRPRSAPRTRTRAWPPSTKKYLGRPLSEVSHRLLHRAYTDRSARRLPMTITALASAACAGATQ